MLPTMTIIEAKELLKDGAVGISDEQIEKEIETASLLKNIFFDLHKVKK